MSTAANFQKVKNKKKHFIAFCDLKDSDNLFNIMISAYGLDLAHGVIEKAASLDLSIPVWKDGKVIFKKVTVKATSMMEVAGKMNLKSSSLQSLERRQKTEIEYLIMKK